MYLLGEYQVRTVATSVHNVLLTREMIMPAKSERMNLRCSAESLATLRDAAELQGQDMTSFVLGAALDRARSVLAEDRILRLNPAEIVQLERALDAHPTVIPQLARLFAGVDTKQAGRRAREDAHQ